MSTNRLRLIINADDLGLNANCTKAIVEAFERGLITDTTMVANGEAFDEGVKAALGKLKGRVGIHLNLTEGEPLTAGIKRVREICEEGVFADKINRLKPLSRAAKNAVYEELTAQVRRLRNSGVEITHADSHHHIHTAPFIAPIVARVCRENGIRMVRLHRNIGKIGIVKMVGKKIYNAWLRRRFMTTDFFGSVEDTLAQLPKEGVLEIMVHPLYDEKGVLIDKEEKSEPLECARRLINGSELVCYSDLLE